jgi:hypothetical protein
MGTEVKISTLGFFIIGLLTSPLSAVAANIEATPMGSGQGVIITVIGDLQLGDEKKFVDVALGTPEAVVLLGSNGGNLVAGIEIGKAVRLKGFGTFVPDGATCASACALAWLGGRVRAMGEGAKIGFHAASFSSNGEVTSAGNALVGAYLNQLGLPTSAVIYISETPPGAIRWLTFADAQAHGIDVKKLDLPKTAANPPSNTPPIASAAPPAPVAPATGSNEDKAKLFVATYFQRLSLDTAQAMANVAGAYAPTVTYYSKTVPSSLIQQEKLSFFVRWPAHQYAVDPSSLFASCEGQECQVGGTVAWSMFSAERATRSEGKSSFLFRVRGIDSNGPLIVFEDSKVLSREKQRSSDLSQSSGPVGSTFPSALTGTLLPPYCHMEACSWRSIESRESIDQNRYGELFRVSVRGWSSLHPGGTYDVKTRKTGGGLSEEYVFCSRTRPGVAFSADGKWMAHKLAPDQSDGVYGYNTSDYTLYFAACHGLAVDENAIQARGQALGYRTNSARVAQVDLSAPTDLMNIR